MNNFIDKRMLLEGRFIGDFAVIFPPEDTKDFGWKALSKAYSYIQRNYDLEMDRLDRQMFSIIGVISKGKFIEVNWEESDDLRFAQTRGIVYSLKVTGPDGKDYQINTYKELDQVFKKYGIQQL